MDFKEISNTALYYYYLPPHLLWPHLTVCAQCDVIMTSRVLSCCCWQGDQRVAKGGHFEHRLKDLFRMIVSVNVYNFVLIICQVLTILD